MPRQLPPRPPGLPAEEDKAPEPIGSAHMLPDGTLHLRLQAATPGVAVGEALLVIRPDDHRHAAMVEHLGGIEPGGHRPVPPFPPRWPG